MQAEAPPVTTEPPAAAAPETLGTQTVSRTTLAVAAATALLSAAVFFAQWGAIAGLTMLALGAAGYWNLCRSQGLPCYTVEPEALVQHAGRRQRRYPWSSLSGRARAAKVHLQHFIKVRVDGHRRLLPLAGLAPAERESLCEIVRSKVAHRSRPLP